MKKIKAKKFPSIWNNVIANELVDKNLSLFSDEKSKNEAIFKNELF
jgi:hypothetical protein